MIRRWLAAVHADAVAAVVFWFAIGGLVTVMLLMIFFP